MTISARRDVFQAIADPTRRQIISLVAKKTLNLNAIAGNFDISRPTVSQHIKILQECGVIAIEKVGRERYCKIQPTNLKVVAEWIDPFREMWESRLDSFQEYLHTLHPKTKKHVKSKRR